MRSSLRGYALSGGDRRRAGAIRWVEGLSPAWGGSALPRYWCNAVSRFRHPERVARPRIVRGQAAVQGVQTMCAHQQPMQRKESK